MKPTNTGFKPANYTTPKKKPAKRKPNPTNPIIDKFLDLKYRINDAYRKGGINNKVDKEWVMDRIDDARMGVVLGKGYMLRANDLWTKYETK